jgi:exosortase
MRTARIPEVIQVISAASVVLVLLLMYWEVFEYFVPRWFQEAPYRHCPLVPPIVGWLIWRKRKQIMETTAVPSVAGLLLLAFGLGVYVVGSRTGVRLMVGSSLPIVLLGLVGALMGPARLRLLTVPLLMTFFLIPVPRHVLGHVAFPMQVASARASAALGRMTGLAVTAQGVILDLGQLKFEIAQECSGLNSLLALLVASGVLVEISNISLARKFVVLAVAPVIVLVANVIRLVSVLWISKFISPQFALAALVHGTSDIVIYTFAVIFVLLIISVMERVPRQSWPWLSFINALPRQQTNGT